MAKKRTKLSKAEKANIENKIVAATAVALGGAMVLMFLNNWAKSVYAAGTIMAIKIIMWLAVAAVVAGVVGYFVKKDKKFLFSIPYSAAVAVIFYEIVYGIAGYPHGTDTRFMVAYIVLAVYLVASYVYYGIKSLGK